MDHASALLLRGICRGLHLAGYFCTFGSLLFAATFLRRTPLPGARPLIWAGVTLAFAAGGAWLILQTSYFAAAQTVPAVFNALPTAAWHTLFGQLLLGRMALLLLAVLLYESGARTCAALAAGAGVLAEAWLGHGGAMPGMRGGVLLAVALLHIGAAALWLGTLPVLCLAIACLPEPLTIARRYSVLGKACVTVLLATALAQYALLIGRPAALLDTGYGAAASAKIILLAALILLAARNHLRLTPALPATRAALRRAIGVEIALGLLALLAAGVLLQLAPPAMAGMAMG